MTNTEIKEKIASVIVDFECLNICEYIRTIIKVEDFSVRVGKRKTKNTLYDFIYLDRKNNKTLNVFIEK